MDSNIELSAERLFNFRPDDDFSDTAEVGMESSVPEESPSAGDFAQRLGDFSSFIIFSLAPLSGIVPSEPLGDGVVGAFILLVSSDFSEDTLLGRDWG